jgi:hypothetical protein
MEQISPLNQSSHTVVSIRCCPHLTLTSWVVAGGYATDNSALNITNIERQFHAHLQLLKYFIGQEILEAVEAAAHALSAPSPPPTKKIYS